MNLDDFSTTVDEQRYINPQVALDESNAFIQNLRDTQQARTADIAQDTYNLGTSVPSNLGGLGGAGTYFTSRYQTPQTSEVIANLRATAQAQALNDAMNNLVAQAQQRYSKAYKNYQKRNGGGTPSTTTPTDPQNNKLPVGTNSKKKADKIPNNGSDKVVENTWAGTPYKSNIYKYRKGNLEWQYDAASPYSSTSSPVTAGKDGAIKNIGGRTYIAINNQWYPVTKAPL